MYPAFVACHGLSPKLHSGRERPTDLPCIGTCWSSVVSEVPPSQPSTEDSRVVRHQEAPGSFLSPGQHPQPLCPLQLSSQCLAPGRLAASLALVGIQPHTQTLFPFPCALLGQPFQEGETENNLYTIPMVSHSLEKIKQPMGIRIVGVQF